MKQFILLLILVVPFFCSSQDMNVKKKDGSSESFTLKDIKNIKYTAINCNMIIDGSNAKVYSLEEIRKITFANVDCYAGINEHSFINTEMQLINYPNPFSESTTIEFELTNEETILLNIYNVQGRLVRNLMNSKSQKGNHKINWDSRNNEGNKLTSGIYFCQVKTNKAVLTNKMFLLK